MALSKLVLLVIFLISQSTVSAKLVETAVYKQRVDHFTHGTPLNEATFTQRYYIDRSFWSGANESGPILVFFGGESPLSPKVVDFCGLISQSAPHLGALSLYIEHRFYGLSVPNGSIDLAMADPQVRGTLTMVQALEDFVEIISEVKRNLSAKNSPVIVMGGSYAGILAAMFRVRYPTVAIGALASSAPLYFDDDSRSGNFYYVISKAYEEMNPDCHDRVSRSWKLMDDWANQPGGLDYLSEAFGICGPLFTVGQLKSFLVAFYTFTAQYDGPFSSRINRFCSSVVDPSNADVLHGIARGILATYPVAPPCIELNSWGVRPPFSVLDQNSIVAWKWQMCSELMIGFHSEQETMFPVLSFNRSQFISECDWMYKAAVNPWAVEKRDISTIFEGKTSNIIFSNGLRDPYSSVGVLEDISKTIVAINTREGSHCLDVLQASPDDPKWLVNQRKKKIRIFMDWIKHDRSGASSWKPYHWVILAPAILVCEPLYRTLFSFLNPGSLNSVCEWKNIIQLRDELSFRYLRYN